MDEALEYNDSILDYTTGEIVDTYTVTVRRTPVVDRISALRDTLNFIDLNL